MGRRVLCLQEWKSVKNKESRLLLMPDGPNKGRTKVGRHFPLVNLVLLLQGNVESCPFPQALVTLVPSHHITKTFTHFTSVTSPFQPACLSSRCFHWPSLPNGSPITCCTASLGTPFSGNDLFSSLCVHVPIRPGDLKNTYMFPCHVMHCYFVLSCLVCLPPCLSSVS